MKTEDVTVSHVVVPGRLRALDAAKAKRLAESMEAIGLRQPITVYQDNLDIVLVAGAHRLEAAKILGWEWIESVFMDADEIDRQLWEIDENLMRAELTPTQQAEHLAKRKELWGARESGKTFPSLGGRGNREFASETAEATGVSKRAVNLAVARAEKVSDEIRDDIRGTDLDKGVVLDDLARTAPEKQRERLDEWKSGRQAKIDSDIKDRAAKAVAETIAEYVPPEWWDGLKANLYSAGARNVADQLANLVGESR